MNQKYEKSNTSRDSYAEYPECSEISKCQLLHSHSHHLYSHRKEIKKIALVSIFITLFLIIEFCGHIKTKSLSLLADALHLLVDVAGLVISMGTLKLAEKAPDDKMTFGYDRIEIIGALFSIFFIWAAVFYLAAESIHKYFHPEEIDGKMFLCIALMGLVVNIICMLILHSNYGHCHSSIITGSQDIPGRKQTLNMRATYIHVIGDIIQSIGVVLASIIIFFFPRAVIVDVLCTLFFAGMVLSSTYFVVRDAIRILSERVPHGFNVEEVKHRILSMDKVIKIADLKAWRISVNKMSVSIKIVVDYITMKEYESMLLALKEYLSIEKQVDFVNVQIDTQSTTKKVADERISIQTVL